MKKSEQYHFTIDTRSHSILRPIPPYIDIILHKANVSEKEFPRLLDLVKGYQNDPRLVEMVRQAGDGSAKVPYLLEYGETAGHILETLRGVAQPHLEYIQTLPEKMQAAIQNLLSVNQLPVGYEVYGIPALLELDRIQHEMIVELRGLQAGRRLADDFHRANQAALREIDKDWPKLRQHKAPYWPDIKTIPEKAEMTLQPVFEYGRLKALYETCVIVTAPNAREFQQYIPAALHRPVSPEQPIALIGSPEWLIWEIGKVGRHITRALLALIRQHLEEEKITVEARNYELINHQAMEVLFEYIRKLP